METTRKRGELRIYLGAAPGVGKTFAILGEAHRRRGRGTDVVVGWSRRTAGQRPMSCWRAWRSYRVAGSVTAVSS